MRVAVLYLTLLLARAQNCPPRPLPVPLDTIPAPLKLAVDEWVSGLVAATGLLAPSVQYHLQIGNVTLASGAHGLANVDPAVAANATTLYRIASVTKILTSILLFQLSASGLVRVDDLSARLRRSTPYSILGRAQMDRQRLSGSWRPTWQVSDATRHPSTRPQRRWLVSRRRTV